MALHPRLCKQFLIFEPLFFFAGVTRFSFHGVSIALERKRVEKCGARQSSAFPSPSPQPLIGRLPWRSANDAPTSANVGSAARIGLVADATHLPVGGQGDVDPDDVRGEPGASYVQRDACP